MKASKPLGMHQTLDSPNWNQFVTLMFRPFSSLYSRAELSWNSFLMFHSKHNIRHDRLKGTKSIWEVEWTFSSTLHLAQWFMLLRRRTRIDWCWNQTKQSDAFGNPSREHSFVIKRVNRLDHHRKTTETLIKGSDLCILRCLGGRGCLLFDRRSFKINNIDCRPRSIARGNVSKPRMRSRIMLLCRCIPRGYAFPRTIPVLFRIWEHLGQLQTTLNQVPATTVKRKEKQTEEIMRVGTVGFVNGSRVEPVKLHVRFSRGSFKRRQQQASTKPVLLSLHPFIFHSSETRGT